MSHYTDPAGVGMSYTPTEPPPALLAAGTVLLLPEGADLQRFAQLIAVADYLLEATGDSYHVLKTDRPGGAS